MNQTTLDLPPRRFKDGQAMTIVRNQSSAEILVQMGFPKNRVEKALAATGDKGVQVASDWLLAHVNDPLLDDNSAREYTLYLCPVGKLQQSFLEFWNTTYQECGWNGAHNYFPHITLTPFFKVENRLVSQLSHLLKKITQKLDEPPEQVDLEIFTSYRYTGLFMNEKHEMFFYSIVKEFICQVEKLGIKIDFTEKQLHLSLAYHFSEDKEARLNELARSLDLHLPARWDIRLYSRSPISANYQVRRVLFPYTSAASDELELTPGDFLYVKQADVMSSDDGWTEGLSWLTGCSGVFPLIYSERTAETETWTMHLSVPVVGADLNIETSFANFENKAFAMNKLLASKSHQLTSPITYSTMPCSLSCHSNNNNSCNKKNNSSSNIHNNNNIEHLDIKNCRLVASNIHKPTSPRTITPTTKTQATKAITTKVTVPTTRANNEVKTIKPPIAVFTSKNKSKDASKSSHFKGTQDAKTPPTIPPTQQKKIPQTTVNISSTNTPSVTSQCGINSMEAFTSRKMVTMRGPRQLYVVKHGESVESTFGKDWVVNSFNQGKYTRYDLNMPLVLPAREGGPSDFSHDSPLTVQGTFQATLLGEAMKEKKLQPAYIYSSPALKCVQSAAHLIKGLGIEMKIRIETGLYEWLNHHNQQQSKAKKIPRFISREELSKHLYPIDMNYTSIMSYEELFNGPDEDLESYYTRMSRVTKEVLKKHEAEGVRIVMMTHTGNLDACTRQLTGQLSRSLRGYQELSRKVPYCAVCLVNEALVVSDAWYLIESPILPFAHSNNPKYNWTALTISNLS